MNKIEKLYELKDLAERIILDEEWNDIRPIVYNPEDIYILNERTEKEIRIEITDNEETLREKIRKSYERE